jgi:hypothetical protein
MVQRNVKKYLSIRSRMNPGLISIRGGRIVANVSGKTFVIGHCASSNGEDRDRALLLAYKKLPRLTDGKEFACSCGRRRRFLAHALVSHMEAVHGLPKERDLFP